MVAVLPPSAQGAEAGEWGGGGVRSPGKGTADGARVLHTTGDTAGDAAGESCALAACCSLTWLDGPSSTCCSRGLGSMCPVSQDCGSTNQNQNWRSADSGR